MDSDLRQSADSCNRRSRVCGGSLEIGAGAFAEDQQANQAARRQAKEELHELEEYVEHHKKDIEEGDHHDPNALELFCDQHPDEPECLIYDD